MENTSPFRGRWLLVRIDDDGAAVALELDDFQAGLTIRYDEQIGVLLCTISLSLTGQQTSEVQKWLRDP